MSRPCSGGCGHRLHDCCDADVNEPHQGSCPNAQAVVIEIDMRRLHEGRVIRVNRHQVQLECARGCDLSGATVYRLVERGVLADADPDRLCPRLQEVA